MQGQHRAVGRCVGIPLRRLRAERLVLGLRRAEHRLERSFRCGGVLCVRRWQRRQRMDVHNASTVRRQHAELGQWRVYQIIVCPSNDLLDGLYSLLHASICSQTVSVPADYFGEDPSSGGSSMVTMTTTPVTTNPNATLVCTDFDAWLCRARGVANVPGTDDYTAQDACCECGAYYVVGNERHAKLRQKRVAALRRARLE